MFRLFQSAIYLLRTFSARSVVLIHMVSMVNWTSRARRDVEKNVFKLHRVYHGIAAVRSLTFAGCAYGVLLDVWTAVSGQQHTFEGGILTYTELMRKRRH